MGNHRLGASLINQSGFLAPDFILRYGFLARRSDIGAALFNYHQYYLLGTTRDRRGYLQRTTGFLGYMSYPFNRYRRLDFNTLNVLYPRFLSTLNLIRRAILATTVQSSFSEHSLSWVIPRCGKCLGPILAHATNLHSKSRSGL